MLGNIIQCKDAVTVLALCPTEYLEWVGNYALKEAPLGIDKPVASIAIMERDTLFGFSASGHAYIHCWKVAIVSSSLKG